MPLSSSAIEQQAEHYTDNLQPQINVAGACCLVAAICAVGLRFAARHAAGSGIGPDDITILIALFFTTAFIALVFVEIQNGLGRHLIMLKNITAFVRSVLVVFNLQ